MSQSGDNLDNMDIEALIDDAESESQWQDDATSATGTNPSPTKPSRYPNRVSFKCNRKLLSHSIDPISNSTSVQQQLSHLISKLEVMGERLVQTVTTNDLDNKLNNMVTRDEFQQFTLSLIERADEEKKVLHSKIEKLETANVALQDKLTSLESKIDTANLKADLAIHKANVTLDKCDDLEQHGRSNTIRVYGTEDNVENETEMQTIDVVLRVLKAHLGIVLGRKDIDIAHRMGIYSNNTDESRSIICKFVNRTDKIMVIKKRKNLVATGIVIKEDISQANRKLLDTVSKKDSVVQAWTHNGKVLGKNSDGTIRKFEREIKSAINNFEKKHGTDFASNNTNVLQDNTSPLERVSSEEGWDQVRRRDSRRHYESGHGSYRQAGPPRQSYRGHRPGYRGRQNRGARGWNYNPATDYAWN